MDRLQQHVEETKRALKALHGEFEDMKRHEKGISFILTCRKIGLVAWEKMSKPGSENPAE